MKWTKLPFLQQQNSPNNSNLMTAKAFLSPEISQKLDTVREGLKKGPFCSFFLQRGGGSAEM